MSLVGLATAVVTQLQQETRVIPIVFVGIPDPIASGYVSSLARPGGNLTGLLLHEESIAGKWLSMLKEISPRLTRVAMVGNPKTGSPVYRRAAETIAPSLGVEIVHAPIETAGDIEHAIDSFARVPNGSLLVAPDLTAVLHRDLIIALALRHRLPAVYQARFWVAAGGLMSYGTDRVASFREAAYYVDRNPARRQASRSSGTGADQVRNDHQPQDRQSARPQLATRPAGRGRRGDRVMKRREPFALVGGAAVALNSVHTSDARAA